jgi:putative transposase
LFWSFCYVVLRRVLQLAALRFRSNEFKELEIVVLRHELAVAGELRGLGLPVSATTVRKLLRQAGLGPAGERSGLSWRAFLRAQAHSMLAVDVFTVETVSLQRLYVLFFIELGSRRVHLAGCTANPSGAWVTQRARQLAWGLAERSTSVRF